MISFSVQAILLDIEGTTSSVRFVYDVLFPFARRRVEEFLQKNWHSEEVQAACEQMARDAGGASLRDWTGTDNEEQVRQKVIEEVYRLMDGDIKATGLKELQGLIWRDGFLSGELLSHVYDDVPPALRSWHEAGLRICIYSSGSITAQKLFFAHTEHGDLTKYLHGNYDTTTGPKKVVSSYTAIAGDMKLPAAQILFLSDVVAELNAAKTAGMQTGLCIRPGNAPVKERHSHLMIKSFDQIEIANV